MFKSAMQFLPFLLLALFTSGCGPSDENRTANPVASPSGGVSEHAAFFEEVLGDVDSLIGKRFQSMQMEAMSSASYMYDGTIDKITEVVDPLAEQAGFASDSSGAFDEHFQEGLDQMRAMPNMEMEVLGNKTYTHEDGTMLLLMRADITQNFNNQQVDMKMLTVQMMNPAKMSEMGDKLSAPAE